MKLNRLDTHDKYIDFLQKSETISKGCQDCINKRPEEFKNLPFYIYAHKRTIESDERIALFTSDLRNSLIDPNYIRHYQTMESVPSARVIWVPRLTKPDPEENSMLFKAYPPSDNIKIIWIIPSRELWDQYTHNKMFENSVVCESIFLFKNNKKKLQEKETDDLSDNEANKIYNEISRNAKKFKRLI